MYFFNLGLSLDDVFSITRGEFLFSIEGPPEALIATGWKFCDVFEDDRLRGDGRDIAKPANNDWQFIYANL